MPKRIPKDNKANVQTHEREWDARESQIAEWWYQTQEAHYDNRIQMAIDHGFVDGDQWTAEDRLLLEERGQAALVFNEIKPAVEWLTGTQRRLRTDWVILPREGGEQANLDAKIKTDVIKYINDVNHTAWEWSAAFRSAVSGGVDWLEIGLRSDPTDDPIFVRRESWRNIWWDHRVTQFGTLEDARYLFRSKIVDLDIAIALMPQHRLTLEHSAESVEFGLFDPSDPEGTMASSSDGRSTRSFGSSSTGHNQRLGVRLLECWYRVPKVVKKLYGQTLYPNQILDPGNPEMAREVKEGFASTYDAIHMEMRQAILVDTGGSLHQRGSSRMLMDNPSPYKHDLFPFVPVWAYRRDVDGMPYGTVRSARDPQVDLNKRRSKASWILSSNRVVMDDDALPDDVTMEDFEAEVARPDAIIRKRRGSELNLNVDRALAAEHVVLEERDKDYIREVTGVTGENLGVDTRVRSGVAMREKRETGQVVTLPLFDNLRLSTQVAGTIMLSLIEQALTNEMQVPVLNERGQHSFRVINGITSDGTKANDITRLRARFVVSEQDFRDSMREAMFEALVDMLGKLGPEVAMPMLDMVFELSDMPEPIKSEWVRRLRSINGQPDPEEDTEEARNARKQAMEQQKAQAAQTEETMQQLAIAKAQADVDERMARATESRRRSGESYMRTLQMGAEVVAPAAIAGPHVMQVASEIADEGMDAQSRDVPAEAEPPLPTSLPSEANPPIGTSMRRMA